MSKFKRYFVTEETTKTRVYEVYDKTKKEALQMVKLKSSFGYAGTPEQKGFNSIFFSTPLEPVKKYRISYEVKPVKGGHNINT